MKLLDNTIKSIYGNIFDNTSDMIVISIGGNDLYDNMSKIIFGVTTFFNGVVNEQFINDYDNIIIQAKNNNRKVLLTSIYLPYIGSFSTYGLFSGLANNIVEKWNSFLFQLGKKHNIPILDLSQTLDCNNRKHYGTSDHHSSNIATKCISHCINYIYHNYNGFGIYFAPKCDFTKIQVSNISH